MSPRKRLERLERAFPQLYCPECSDRYWLVIIEPGQPEPPRDCPRCGRRVLLEVLVFHRCACTTQPCKHAGWTEADWRRNARRVRELIKTYRDQLPPPEVVAEIEAFL